MKILLTAMFAFLTVALFGQQDMLMGGPSVTTLSVFDACLTCNTQDVVYEDQAEPDMAIDNLIDDLRQLKRTQKSQEDVLGVLGKYNNVFKSTSFDYAQRMKYKSNMMSRGAKRPSSRGVTNGKPTKPQDQRGLSDGGGVDMSDSATGKTKPGAAMTDADAAAILSANAAKLTNSIQPFTLSRGATRQPDFDKRMYLRKNAVLQIKDFAALDCGGKCNIHIDVIPVTDNVKKKPYVSVMKNGDSISAGSGTTKIDDAGDQTDRVVPSAYIYDSGIYNVKIRRTAK